MIYFVAIWYIYVMAIWYIFSRFGMLYQKKSGKPVLQMAAHFFLCRKKPLTLYVAGGELF
jgi:hypothetical protein